MASSSKKIHVRSNSFPSSSNPSTFRVDEEINQLRVLESSAASTSESIYKGLTGLEDLYICVDELLNLASTQQVLSQYTHEKYVEELLDGSVRILDVCEVTRDVLAQIKEQVKDLQSALRRRKGDLEVESSIHAFISYRKKMKKDVKKLITSLKQVYNKCQAFDLDVVIAGTLREVGFISITIFESLLVFLSASKSKSSKWSLVSKLMHKEKVACEEKSTSSNELVDVDAALLSLCKSQANNDKLQCAQEKLEALDMSIEALESGLENLFRRMIKTRASILNILSQ